MLVRCSNCHERFEKNTYTELGWHYCSDTCRKIYKKQRRKENKAYNRLRDSRFGVAFNSSGNSV